MVAGIPIIPALVPMRPDWPDCRDRHVKMEMLDSMVLGAVRDKLLEPTMLVRVG